MATYTPSDIHAAMEYRFWIWVKIGSTFHIPQRFISFIIFWASYAKKILLFVFLEPTLIDIYISFAEPQVHCVWWEKFPGIAMAFLKYSNLD